MALTSEELTAAFIAAGWDTQDKVVKNLQLAGHQMKRAGLLIALDGLAQEQSAATSAIEAKRQGLNSAVQAETDAITAAVSQ